VLDILQPIAQTYDLSIPEQNRRPLAIVGAGGIVDYAHLPAYEKAGLEVVGIYDLDSERAADVAQRHGISKKYGSLDELLDDSRVEVVDIAVLPWAQPEIASAALEAGKHLLCQKPLAIDVETAEGLSADAESRGLKLAVNQQLRFDEGIAVARAMVDSGWIGQPVAMSMTVNIKTDWSMWPWIAASDRIEIMYHSIHYFDAIRSILGDPELVWCTGSRTPGQEAVGETRTMSTLVFPGHTRALVHVTHENLSGDFEATFRIDGSKGAIKGTLGLLYDYPRGRPDTLEVYSRSVPTDGWVPYPVTTRWVPDAFAGPVGSLLEAIATDGVPATAGADNLNTLRLVHALYRSMDSGESQRLKGAGRTVSRVE
jgi:predicted dehydrogenase